MTYQDLCTYLALDKNFALARYGDGEFLCASGAKGENCDRHRYFPTLGLELRKILNTPQEYVMAAQPTEHGLYSDRDKYQQNWTDADLMHKASEEGKIKQLIDALSQRNVIVVGNNRHKALNKHIRVWEFVEVPMINAWTFYPKLLPSVLHLAMKNENVVFLFMAGMTTNVLIDKCYKANKNNTYLDCGSVFDIYLGKKTRSYHDRVNPKWIE